MKKIDLEIIENDYVLPDVVIQLTFYLLLYYLYGKSPPNLSNDFSLTSFPGIIYHSESVLAPELCLDIQDSVSG